MTHAVYDGDWKLVVGESGKGVTLYNLATDLAEEKNLITDPAQAGRVRQMEKQYQWIRSSRRSAILSEKSE